MLNGEKFLKEIKDLDYFFALKENKILNCDSIEGCSGCAFDGCCWFNRTKWLLEEYKDPILDDEGKNYIKTLILPFNVNEIVSIVKHSVYGELRYELIIDLVNAKMFVYFDRESMVGEMLAKMKSNHSYNAKELGLC